MINTARLLRALCNYAPYEHAKPFLAGVHIARPNETDVVFEASVGTTAIRVALTKHDVALMFVPVGTDVILCKASLEGVLLNYDDEANPALLIDGQDVMIDSHAVKTLSEPYGNITRAINPNVPCKAEAVHLNLELITAVTLAMADIMRGDGKFVAKFESRGRDESQMISVTTNDGDLLTAVVMPVRTV